MGQSNLGGIGGRLRNSLHPAPQRIEVTEPEPTCKESLQVQIAPEQPALEAVQTEASASPTLKAQPEQILTAQTPMEATKAKRKYTKRKK